MALQDLTPQLRTRLGRVERMVGVFVIIATVLLLSGFSYYLYHTAQRKGWLEVKAPFFTYVDSAAGLREGDVVRMMGFPVGEIRRITAEDPGKDYDVYVEFHIKGDNIGYMWTDSRVRVNSADFLGGRFLEVMKGGWNGYTNADGSKKNLHAIYKLQGKHISEVWLDHAGTYTNFAQHNKPYWLIADETPALSKRAEKLVAQAEAALPNLLSLTNQLAALLATTTRAITNLDARVAELKPIMSNANYLVASFHPVSTNLHRISANLTNPAGSLGNWLLPTNLNASAEQTLLSVRGTLAEARTSFSNANQALADTRRLLQTADGTIAHTDTNLTTLALNLDRSLSNLANLTSNLNAQVAANTNLVSAVSSAIAHTDQLVQGLQHHWLLRSAFKEKPPAKPPKKK